MFNKFIFLKTCCRRTSTACNRTIVYITVLFLHPATESDIIRKRFHTNRTGAPVYFAPHTLHKNYIETVRWTEKKTLCKTRPFCCINSHEIKQIKIRLPVFQRNNGFSYGRKHFVVSLYLNRWIYGTEKKKKNVTSGRRDTTIATSENVVVVVFWGNHLGKLLYLVSLYNGGHHSFTCQFNGEERAFDDFLRTSENWWCKYSSFEHRSAKNC